ncbi:hypothetical protein B0H13DRAFT_961444 [Mycena leptocephala]|nr:hypothetical protein B0H13DRAFT_961444 [Mycena leptocephala]
MARAHCRGEMPAQLDIRPFGQKTPLALAESSCGSLPAGRTMMELPLLPTDGLIQNRPQAAVFAIQELVENCIQRLRGLDRDLKSCSLVCLAWVYPAQSYLFDRIVLASDRTPSFGIRSRHLLDVLQSSPHLIHFVHELWLQLDDLCEQDLDVLAGLSSIPFASLQRLFLCNYTLPTRDHLIISFQQLISIHSLHHLEISCRFDTLIDFHRIFQTRAVYTKPRFSTCLDGELDRTTQSIG